MTSNEKIYISMNSEKKVDGSINFTNENNVFTGQFNIVKDEVPTNIEDIFSSKEDVSEIKNTVKALIIETDLKEKILCRVITGPTASGKSGIAIRLAVQEGFHILCMDSMQIYRGMNIGTAKPTAEEQQLVPHHLLDIADPRDTYSVAAWRDTAVPMIRQMASEGKQVLFVGGTGLYLDSLIHPMAMGSVPADEELRRELRIRGETLQGRNELHEMLRKLDPETAERLPVNDLRRVIRAIEVSQITGIPFSKQPQDEQESEFYWREILYHRIEGRVDQMIADGLADEVRSLLDSGVPENAQSMSGLGYKEMTPYLRGMTDLATAIREIKLGTRHYAKRQTTYMKRFEKAVYVDPMRKDAYERIMEVLL